MAGRKEPSVGMCTSAAAVGSSVEVPQRLKIKTSPDQPAPSRRQAPRLPQRPRCVDPVSGSQQALHVEQKDSGLPQLCISKDALSKWGQARRVHI